MEDETMDDGMRFGTEADDAWQKHEQYIRGGFRNVIGDLFVNTGGDDSYDGEMDDVIDDPCPDPPQQHHAEPPPSRPPWINRIVDMDKLMSDLFRPGTNHVTDGMRGGGKTHQAVAYTEAMVKGAFPSMPHVVMLTNIIFVKRISKVGPLESQFVMETPPGVYHVTSMEEMFRVITRLFRQYGRTNVMFMLVLDEAQNFLLADEYQQDTSINFIKLYGTTRKFNMCIWLLTPSINNLPPRARNFLDADPSGYVTCQWRKNKHAALEYIREHHIQDADPREFTTMKMGQNAIPIQFRVGSTSWTRPLEELEVGEYGYDHLANADFRVSISRQPDREFDFTRFMEVCSDVPSYRIASVMQHFFDRMDGKVKDEEDEQQQTDPKAEKAQEIRKMRDLNLTFDQIEYVTGIPASTCRLWLKKYASDSASGEHDGAGSPDRTGCGGPVRPVRGRTPKGASRTGSGNPEFAPETPEKPLEKGDYSGDTTNLSVAENSDSQRFAQQQLNPPSDAPYMYIPSEAENEEVPCADLREGPRTVGGRLTPKNDDSNSDGGGA